MSKKPDFDVGLATGVKYWIVFMLGLAVLGYSPLLSITFGAIGALPAASLRLGSSLKMPMNPRKQRSKQKKKREKEKNRQLWSNQRDESGFASTVRLSPVVSTNHEGADTLAGFFVEGISAVESPLGGQWSVINREIAADS